VEKKVSIEEANAEEYEVDDPDWEADPEELAELTGPDIEEVKKQADIRIIWGKRK
jgi:hypothetical protein